MAAPWSQGPSVFLHPSEVSYLTQLPSLPGDDGAASQPADWQRRLGSVDLADYARRLMSHDSRYPKLQVARQSGRWYALNSLHLAICQHLESTGRCNRVRALVCPARMLPGNPGDPLPGDQTNAAAGSSNLPTAAAETIAAATAPADLACGGSDWNGSSRSSDSCSSSNSCSSDSCQGTDSFCSECDASESVGSGVGQRKRRRGRRMQNSMILVKTDGDIGEHGQLTRQLDAGRSAASSEATAAVSDAGELQHPEMQNLL